MKKLLFILLTINLTTSCTGQSMKDLKPVENVDIQRFMGKWYVIAIKPNWIEKNPFNSIEEYSLNKKGHIDVKYSFNQNTNLYLKTSAKKTHSKQETYSLNFGLSSVF